MSYVIEQFDKGEVKFRNGAAGWLVDGEFRPLMDDALQELFSKHLISKECMRKTKDARQEYTAGMFLKYAESYKGPSAEERAEARAAMGAGVAMVNMITGHKWRT